MERAASDTEKRRRARLPWLLLTGLLGASGVGGWLASRSIASLLTRVEQLEREAADSETQVAELQVLRDSMARRLRVMEQQQQGLAAALGGKTVEPGAQLAKREAVRAELESLLRTELETGEAFLEEAEGGLRVELAEHLLFEPREAALTPGGAELLTRVGAKLGGVEGHLVQVAAHTDAVRETPERATPATSWELSASRAVTVVHFLGDRVKLPPEPAPPPRQPPPPPPPPADLRLAKKRTTPRR